MKSDNWPLRAKHILKTELKRRRINYSDLADKLAAIGIEENEKNLAKKISRGSFKAAFLFQCLAAIGCESLHLISGEGPLSAPRPQTQPTRHLSGMQNDGRAEALRARSTISTLIAAGIDTQR